MSPIERTLADYKGTGITVGAHIMTHLRGSLAREGVLRAADLAGARNGQWTKIAGLVIVRQRPGTAKGFCFITLEDETGTANAVVVPDMFQRYRAVIHTAAILLIEGPLQKACPEPSRRACPEPGRRADGVIHVRAGGCARYRQRRSTYSGLAAPMKTEATNRANGAGSLGSAHFDLTVARIAV